MITLKWSQYPEAQVTSYNVYRSIVGFIAPLAPLPLTGKTLQLKMNGGPVQTITFDGTPTIAKINATLTGGRAYPATNVLNFILRSDIRDETGSVDITGGTALADLGLNVRTITAKSEDMLIGTVLAPPPPTTPSTDPCGCNAPTVEFEDPDGVLQDWYAVTSIDNTATESLKTAYKQAISAAGPLCVIEGIVVSLQGARIPDAEVSAVIQVPPEQMSPLTNISIDTINTLSGPDGRFSLPLLQGAIVKLECPRIGLSRMIKVPNCGFAFINDIKVDLDYRFPLGYRG